tara:strand:+ start:347 stop:655 length:309 start_codon:yes stop_codon:yes gene_type:complete
MLGLEIMNKILGIIVLGLLLSGCAPNKPGEVTGRLGKYQYSPVQNMVDDNYWIQGWDSDDAFTGARVHCNKVGGNFLIVKLIPHKNGDHYKRRATLTFKCKS